MTAALDEYIRHRKQLEMLKLAGTIDYGENYDYKQARKKRRTFGPSS